MLKTSTNRFYQSFRSLFQLLFTNHLEVHSRRYMFLRKRGSCEYRHCRCLSRIVIALNRRSLFGKIQYTKPPEHLCLLNKLACVADAKRGGRGRKARKRGENHFVTIPNRKDYRKTPSLRLDNFR